MHTLVYDGTFAGWLCSVFDSYYYRFNDAEICTLEKCNGNIFQAVHTVQTNDRHSDRVWAGLQKRLSLSALEQLYFSFHAELDGMETLLFRYVRYVFSSDKAVESDFSNNAILAVSQTAKKVWREKHRMEAFVRFQKTKDDLYYAVIEPDYNVLPLIAPHFVKRYADQRWVIYDAQRKYGIYYDLQDVSNIEIHFSEQTGEGASISAVYDDEEEMYQQLWQQYFNSVNIPSRKNTKLHIQHMPKRYWKYLPEKRP